MRRLETKIFPRSGTDERAPDVSRSAPSHYLCDVWQTAYRQSDYGDSRSTMDGDGRVSPPADRDGTTVDAGQVRLASAQAGAFARVRGYR